MAVQRAFAADGRDALQELERRRAVEKVLELNKVTESPALAESPEYQRKFKGYYKVRQKSQQFYRKFFAILRAGAAKEHRLTLEQLLFEFYRITGTWQLSFCSKLLATLDDRVVIYDRNLAQYFGVKRGSGCDGALNSYRELCFRLAAFIKQPGWSKIRSEFDAKFPASVHLSDTRKADLVIWASSR